MLSLYDHASDIAVSDGGKSYTYGQVNDLVQRLISYFTRCDIQRLSMCVEQGIKNYCLEWAAYLSGITYCCYDIDAPIERIRYCNEIFAPDILVSDKLLDGIDTDSFENLITEKPNVERTPHVFNEIAYVLFTSGTTGLPKGVLVKRTALENVVLWAQNNYNISNETVYAQYSKNSFDLSVLDIFLGLTFGAKLVPFRGFNKLLPANLIKQEKITHWHSVPSAFVTLQNRHALSCETLSSIKTVVFCGETLYPQLVKEIFECKPNLNLWNTYGPTEATIFCSAIKLNAQKLTNEAEFGISIGNPISGVNFFLEQNSYGNELIIVGENVASGYLNDTDDASFFHWTTNDKVLPAYRSGDLVNKIDELYYFVCRRDNQVKIAGNRFDLNEITNLIQRMGLYSVASVTVGNLIYTFVQLPLYCQNIKIEDINNELKKHLPKYGLPAKIIILDDMPLNSNGKIDKNKLMEIILNGGYK